MIEQAFIIEKAPVSAAEALKWAEDNKVKLPDTGRLGAINVARSKMGLPSFSIIKQATEFKQPFAMKTAKEAMKTDAERLLEIATVAVQPGWQGARDRFEVAIRGDANLLWEMFSNHWMTESQLWLSRAQCAGKSSGDQRRVESDHHRNVSRNHGAMSVGNVAKLSLLKTFRVGQKPIGKCTSREANEWAERRNQDVKFVRLLTQNLPLDEPIGKYRNDEYANEAFVRSKSDD